MNWLTRWTIRRSGGPMVRPWALACPILVLLLASPFMQPLFNPQSASSRQTMTLESVRSLLRHRTLEINSKRIIDAQAVYYHDHRFYSLDAPNFTILLASVSWGIERAGVLIDDNAILHEYLLILFAITFPTAMASGLIYRMARSFELTRWWRMLLAMASVLATGWLSYSVVLMPPALSAALVTIAAASLWHVSSARNPMLAVGWLSAGAFCAATAATIDFNASWMLVLMPITVLSMKLPWRVRCIGLMLLVAGAAPPITLHASVTPEITGDLLPPRYHASILIPDTPVIVSPIDEYEPVDASIWVGIGRMLNRALVFTIGDHGIFSHFPVLVIAVAGALMVLHRHWGRTLKCLAGGVLIAICAQLLVRMALRTDSQQLSYAAPGMVSILPLMILFCGAWVRRPHAAMVWALAGIALGVSMIVTIIGATGPAPDGGFTRYTPVQAVEKLFISRKTAAQSVPPHR